MTYSSPGSSDTDHGGLEVLDLVECRRLLEREQIGRIAFVSAGDPLILPINYRMHRGNVVFRTTTGEKLDAARNAASVGFEIDSWDLESQTGWSVIVSGIAQDVEDPEAIGEMKTLGLRPWADAVTRNNWVRIIPNEITGRRIS
ncbi:MAG: pyridoxamine 5'-phosphate oxidase family protein [Acidimicrobiia bacterium]|nr:pyridoxamine 5'-phosphate oxidase family protein [Acidimicrobiia bacterium]